MGLFKDLLLSQLGKGAYSDSGLMPCLHCGNTFWSSRKDIDEYVCTACKRSIHWYAYKDCSCSNCTSPITISHSHASWVDEVFPHFVYGYGNLANDQEKYAAHYGFANRWEMAKAALQRMPDSAKLVGGLATIEDEIGKRFEKETTEDWLKRLNLSEAGAVFKFLKIVKRCPFTISDIPY